MSGQPESTPASSPGSAGQLVDAGDLHAGCATASVAARPDTVAQPTAFPSAPGSAPKRAVPSSSAVRATVATGSTGRRWRPAPAGRSGTAWCRAGGSGAAPSGSRCRVPRPGRPAAARVGSGTGGRPSSGPGTRARLPAPRVAQPSSTQVVERAARTDMAPIADSSASAHSSGVPSGSMSVQVRPGTPTTTTRSAARRLRRPRCAPRGADAGEQHRERRRPAAPCRAAAAHGGPPPGAPSSSR